MNEALYTLAALKQRGIITLVSLLGTKIYIDNETNTYISMCSDPCFVLRKLRYYYFFSNVHELCINWWNHLGNCSSLLSFGTTQCCNVHSWSAVSNHFRYCSFPSYFCIINCKETYWSGLNLHNPFSIWCRILEYITWLLLHNFSLNCRFGDCLLQMKC